MFGRLTLPPGWLLRLEYDPAMGSHPISLAVSQAGKGSVAIQLPLSEVPNVAALQKYVDMFVAGAMDDMVELGPDGFPPIPPFPSRAPVDYSSAPRDPSGGPRPGDAFLVEGRRAPLIVDQVLLDEAPQPDSAKLLLVTTADGQIWALFRRPDTADGPPFPLFTGSIVTSHPDPGGE